VRKICQKRQSRHCHWMPLAVSGTPIPRPVKLIESRLPCKSYPGFLNHNGRKEAFAILKRRLYYGRKHKSRH